MAEEVYLSLGSNLGDRQRNLEKACHAVEKLLSGFRRSSIYETLPLYRTDQNRFLNMVVAGRSDLEPTAFLLRLQAIEEGLGRDREHTPPKGPRVIDIDILLYGNSILSTEALRIPHPGIVERQFVLIPLLEISPGLRDPVTSVSYAAISKRLPDQGVYMFPRGHYNKRSEPG